MALLASEYEERLRLLDIANGYRDDAAQVEACETRFPLGQPTSRPARVIPFFQSMNLEKTSGDAQP